MLSRGCSDTQPASIKLVRSLPRMHLLNSLSVSVDLSSTDSLPHNLGPNIAVVSIIYYRVIPGSVKIRLTQIVCRVMFIKCVLLTNKISLHVLHVQKGFFSWIFIHIFLLIHSSV